MNTAAVEEQKHYLDLINVFLDPDELCLPGEEFSSGLYGWWGATNPSWNSIEQCTNNDIPAGIQVMYYYQPDNILQPDQVSTVYLSGREPKCNISRWSKMPLLSFHFTNLYIISI